MSVSREVRSASSGSGAGGTGCLLACQPARVRLGGTGTSPAMTARAHWTSRCG